MENENISESKKTCGCRKRVCVGITALIFLICGIVGVTVTCFILEQKVLKFRNHYGVIFDAGSSHTDVTVYQWPSEYKDHGTAVTSELVFANCSDVGISNFTDKPTKAGEMIKNCIETVVLKSIPHKDVKKTPIYLGATAGMRLLCERNNRSCDAILNSIRNAFNSFVFRQTKNRVRVLTGKEEALFGWITANILNGALNGSKPAINTSLIGALDMGGGSVEMSFIPKNSTVPTKYEANVRMYGKDYSFYAHSYLCYGFNEAHRRLLADLVEASNYSSEIVHPCLNENLNITRTANSVWLSPCSKRPMIDLFPLKNETYTFIGSGNVTECHKKLQLLFNHTECYHINCTFDGVYQPPLTGKFIAFSGFGKTAKFLNVSSNLEKLNKNGDRFCKEDWNSIKKTYGSSNVMKSMCFQASYSYELLTEGLKFPKSSMDIQFEDKINGAEVGWSLGFMLNTTNGIPVESPSYRISHQEFIVLLVISSTLTILGVAIFVVCLVKKNMKRNMKYKYSMLN